MPTNEESSRPRRLTLGGVTFTDAESIPLAMKTVDSDKTADTKFVLWQVPQGTVLESAEYKENGDFIAVKVFYCGLDRYAYFRLRDQQGGLRPRLTSYRSKPLVMVLSIQPLFVSR